MPPVYHVGPQEDALAAQLIDTPPGFHHHNALESAGAFHVPLAAVSYLGKPPFSLTVFLVIMPSFMSECNTKESSNPSTRSVEIRSCRGGVRGEQGSCPRCGWHALMEPVEPLCTRMFVAAVGVAGPWRHPVTPAFAPWHPYAQSCTPLALRPRRHAGHPHRSPTPYLRRQPSGQRGRAPLSSLASRAARGKRQLARGTTTCWDVWQRRSGGHRPASCGHHGLPAHRGPRPADARPG
jgi:hypothetical protein